MKKILLGLSLVVLAITALYFFTLYRGDSEVTSENTSVTPTLAEENEKVNNQKLTPNDWEEYQSNQIGISLYYPPDMDMSEDTGEGTRFVKLGPSQSRGTEVYDGIILSFSKIEYEEPTLKQYVQSQYNQKKADDIYVEVTEIEDIKINNYSGYKYTESALGTFTNIYLPAKGKTAIYISYLLEDPKNQGFKEILDTILNSLLIQN